MKDIYISEISRLLGVQKWQVVNCVELLGEGATVPFISRYRKEKTGSLSDVDVASVKHHADAFDEMEKRKDTILATISEAGALTDALKAAIESTVDSRTLEDLYLPYKPKRRTRATIAREAGAGPLAEAMWNFEVHDPEIVARKYINEKAETVPDVLSFARDIIAEKISETAAVREQLRKVFLSRNIVSKATKKASENPSESSKYRAWMDYREPLSRIAPHRLLAMLRAADEGFLSLKIDASPEKSADNIYYILCKGRRFPAKPLEAELRKAIGDSYSRLLEPSITGEVLAIAKEKADAESIRIFGENLRQLLLAPPVGGHRTLAIDPGFRTGCKVVCLDEMGNLLHHEAIFPHPPQNEKVKSIMAVSSMLEKYGIECIAIGSGTASRETEEFIRKVSLPDGVRVFTVSEDGASIYSASDVAREEFPDEDVTVRGAVSIGRRLMDPLAELVKIDPKSLGVGQYQWDVDQKLLKEKLDSTVESCVNAVGVNLNTASEYLLRYVSGVGPTLAHNIVEYRTGNGAFSSREQLRDVKRLGDKVFQQCAGFLRIPGAENPLDNSAVHPETYGLVRRMASSLGVEESELAGSSELCSRLRPEDFVTDEFGIPTITDIIRELAKPGLDPRAEATEFEFCHDIHSIEDLSAGMTLPGIVTNITAFGAFVDIGIKTQGLVHVSRMGVPRGTDPSSVLSLHQHISVTVDAVELDRGRISLSLNKSN
ncbi:MAG: RNA-binding transcriptional accessory protein [Bacteroidales bacterium]|nr:RNA-binding transcriptional accessory protein [Bacteroidales bacterium]